MSENREIKPEEKNAKKKINETLDRGLKLVDKGRQSITEASQTINSLNSAIDKANNLMGGVQQFQNMHLESQRIKKAAELGLEKIKSDNQAINKHIDTEYKKQKEAMDKGSDVVDAGLASNDIEKIREGLSAMIQVANTNPMANLKKSLDEDLNQDYLDEDFIIEI